MRFVVRTGAWAGILLSALGVLAASGSRLAPPPVHDPAALRLWIERTDPALATFSLLRLAAVAVVAYLLVATAVRVVARVSRVPALIAASTRVTVAPVDRLLRHVVGAGLALTLAGAAAAPAASAAPRPVGPDAIGFVASDPTPVDVAETTPPGSIPVLHALDDDLRLVHLGPVSAADTPPAAGSATDAAPTTPSTRRPPPGPMTAADGAAHPAPAVERDPTGPDAGPAPPPDAVVPAVPPAGASPAPPDPPADDRRSRAEPPHPAAADHHTIVAGEHLWGIAEHTLAVTWGTAPEPAETAAYLQRLIDANRSVLAVTDDPDLVFPGQVFTLPALDAR